jgi:hypothetical protein
MLLLYTASEKKKCTYVYKKELRNSWKNIKNLFNVYYHEKLQ